MCYLAFQNDYSALTDVELLELYNNGDKEACTALIIRYAALINGSVKGKSVHGIEIDDIRQEAYMGLFNAVRSYKPDSGASFSTYATTCVKNRVVNLIVKSGTYKFKMNKSALSYDGGAEFSLSDNTKNPEYIFIQGERYDDIIRSIERHLSAFEKDVLFLYLGGRDYKTIAEKLNSSQKSVDNALQRARKKLKAVLNNLT